MTPLESLIHPLTIDAFRREVWGQRARHLPGGATRHAGLFGWEALDRLLNAAPAPHPALRLYRGEAGFVAASSASEVIAHLRSGAGLILNDADRYDPALAGLVDALEAELDETARVNVYASQPGEAGFPLHADTHDVFALQIAGQKRWRVTGPTMPDPLFHASLPPQPPADPTPYLEQTLSPGDVLYVPRGHRHEAVAVDGPSLHLTLAVFFTTGVDLLYHLVDALHQSPAFRKAFPLHSGPFCREGEPPAPQRAHLAHLRAAMDAILSDPGLLPGLRDARLGARQPRRPFALSAHAQAAVPAGASLTCAVKAVRMRAGEGFFDVLIPGRRLRFPPPAAPLLRWIFAAEEISAAALRAAVPGASPELIGEVLTGLVAEGVLHRAG